MGDCDTVLSAAISEVGTPRGGWWGYARFLIRRKYDGRVLLKNLRRDGHTPKRVIVNLLKLALKHNSLGFLRASDHHGIADVFNTFSRGHRLVGKEIRLTSWGTKCYSVRGPRQFAREISRSSIESELILMEELSIRGKRWLRSLAPPGMIDSEEDARVFIEDLGRLPEADWRSVLRHATIGTAREPGDKAVVWVTNEDEAYRAFRERRVSELCIRLALGETFRKRLLVQYDLDPKWTKAVLRFPTPFDVGWDQGQFRTCPCTSPCGRTYSDGIFPPLNEAVHESIPASLITEFPLMS